MTDLPAPLVPADVDLRDFAFMPLDVNRLLTSETWLLGSGDECKAAMALWCVSWHQVPAASLPTNDKMLAHLSAAGPRWRKVKDHALRGWVLCNDGRLYHPVVAEKAIEAWGHKRKQSERGKAGAAKRWSGDSGGNGASSSASTDGSTDTSNASAMPAPMLADSKGQGPDRDQTRQGSEEREEGAGAPTPALASGVPRGSDPDPDDLLPLAFDRTTTGEAVRRWNAMAAQHDLPAVAKLTEARCRALKARLRDAGGLDGVTAAIERVARSAFCRGGNDRTWRADFDWFVSERGFTRLMEGKFDDRQPNGGVDWDREIDRRLGGTA